jgi:hypothetical protein
VGDALPTEEAQKTEDLQDVDPSLLGTTSVPPLVDLIHILPVNEPGPNGV